MRSIQYFFPCASPKTKIKTSMVGFDRNVCYVVTTILIYADLTESNNLQESVKGVKNSIKMVKSKGILHIILLFDCLLQRVVYKFDESF